MLTIQPCPRALPRKNEPMSVRTRTPPTTARTTPSSSLLLPIAATAAGGGAAGVCGCDAQDGKGNAQFGAVREQQLIARRGRELRQLQGSLQARKLFGQEVVGRVVDRFIARVNVDPDGGFAGHQPTSQLAAKRRIEQVSRRRRIQGSRPGRARDVTRARIANDQPRFARLLI